MPTNSPSPIDETLAATMANNYRNQTTKVGITKLILHNMADLRDMVDNVFILYTNTVALPTKCEWRIALCPMHYDDNGTEKLNASFIPAIINMATMEVHDYFESKAAKDTWWQYFDELMQKVQTGTGGTFIFDEGAVWP